MALDVIGLPEVIYTSEGEKYLHLPGLIVTENLTGEVRYLLTDGLGSVRHATDDAGAVVYEQSYDPYGNPIVNHQSSIEKTYYRDGRIHAHDDEDGRTNIDSLRNSGVGWVK